MIRIDALLFLFIVEFLLIFMGLAIYMFFRYRGRSKEVIILEKKRMDFIRFLEESVIKFQQKIKKFKDGKESENEETMLVREAIEIKVGFMLAALDGCKKGEGDEKIFWEHLAGWFDKFIGGQLKRIRELEIEKDKIHGEITEGKPRAAGDREECEQKAMEEKKALHEQVQELEQEIEEQKKAQEKLQKEYDYLESEYTILYKEHKNEDI